MKLKISQGLQNYAQSLITMHELIQNQQPTCWFIEYTSVTTDKCVGRGGGPIYHGPGQRVVYFITPLFALASDLPTFISKLEQLVVDCCSMFDVRAYANIDGPGVWIDHGKVAFIGLRLNKDKWLSHGIAINCMVDLTKFEGLDVCNKGAKVANIGVNVTDFDQELIIQLRRSGWL